MKALSEPLLLLALAVLAACTSTGDQDPIDRAATRDLVARVEATGQEAIGELLRSLAAQSGEDRTVRVVRLVLLEGQSSTSVTGKILNGIDALGLAALPVVRDAVRVPALQPASVWALQSYCVGAAPEAEDHPLTNNDIVYLGSLLQSVNHDTIKAVAVTLKSAGSRQRLVLPDLIDALRKQSARAGSESSSLCSSLLICIGHVGSAAESAVPVVLRKLDDEPDGSMRSLILWTLCSIIPDSRKALTVLIEAFVPQGEREDLLKLLQETNSR